ncbi:MAG: nucleotidyl transferase AbiEii/AbiGii toxin family protein [Coriobacteriales bacterium]|jgi:predicted nucleotidyltransferase component of viral defense system|nr:nucleotidyl transferase AbiEii/AbiGii toxin family protein [Coriobacteriales bacterium]
MTEKIAFRKLAESIAANQGQVQMLPVIEKELLHYEILSALSEKSYLKNLVFQGGTALRLCYGASRMSEDLDFAGGDSFDANMLHGMKEAVEAAITRRYDVDVRVKEPKRQAIDQRDTRLQKVTVERWQIRVVTMRKRPDIPQQLIKLEIATIPTYERIIRPLLVNYPELPEGYGNVLLPVESLKEILADKLVSLAVAQNIRYRDFWDLRWISTNPAQPSQNYKELVLRKVSDYGITDYAKQVEQMVERLEHNIESREFLAQMRRFIPTEILAQTMERPAFRTYLVEHIKELYRPFMR